MNHISLGSADGSCKPCELARSAGTSADEKLWAELWKLLWGLCYARAMDKMKNPEDASDCVIDAWKSAALKIHLWDPGGGCFGHWLMRIVSNKCLDELRKRGRLKVEDDPDDLENLPEEGEDTFEKVIANEDAKILWEALQTLSEFSRILLMLRFDEERSRAEVAQLGTYGTTPQNVGYHERRALEMLRQRLHSRKALQTN